MRNPLTTVLACLLVGILIIGCAGQAAAETKTVAVKRGDLVANVTTYGNLTMPHRVDLNFAVAGSLKDVRVVRGDQVKKGQTLAILDDTTYQDTVRRQTLQLQQDEKSLELAELDFGRTQELLEEATPRTGQSYTYYTDMPTVRSNISWAVSKIEEITGRIKAGELSYVDLDLAYTMEHLNNALLSASKSQFIPVERTKTVAETLTAIRQLTFNRDRAWILVERARVSQESTKFVLEQAKRDLSRTVLTAPFDGIVTEVSKLDEGSSVTASTRILHLVDTTRVEMNGLMVELDIASIKTGQEATIVVDAMPGVELKGTISYISPVTTTTGVVSYPVTITLAPQSDGALKDGMTATATINLGRRTGALLVPVKSVTTAAGRQTVQVVVDQRTGRTEQRQVATGLSDGTNVEIVSGLREGETVVVS